MASCFVSITFALPLSASQTMPDEINRKKLAMRRLLGKAVSKSGYFHRIRSALFFDIATDISTLWSSCGLINSASCGSHQLLTIPSKHSTEIVPSCLRVSSRTITGIWVGPDIEVDGWGFVECTVHRIM